MYIQHSGGAQWKYKYRWQLCRQQRQQRRLQPSYYLYLLYAGWSGWNLDFGICGCRLRMQLLLYVPANKKVKWKKSAATQQERLGRHKMATIIISTVVWMCTHHHHHYSSSSQENGERNPRCVEFLFFLVFFLFPIRYYCCVITLDTTSYLMAGNPSRCRNATNWLW